MNEVPSGAWPVMLTPYRADSSVDLDVLDRYTDWLIAQGSAGLFPTALSGEMFELSETERLDIARRVVVRAGGRVPVVAAVSEPGTAEETAAAVRRMAATGVDAVALIASVVLAEDDDEQRLRDTVEAVIAANPDTALGIYECPLPYHRLLSLEAVSWLAHTGRFVFFKETSHDVSVMADRVSAASGTPLKVFNAGIENLVQSLAIGVAGLSGWIVNVYPDLIDRLTSGALESDEALRLQIALEQAERAMAPTYPASAKALVDSRAGIGFLPVGRWRPSGIDPAALAQLAAALEGVAATTAATPSRAT